MTIEDLVQEGYPRLMGAVPEAADGLPQAAIAHVRLTALETDPMRVLEAAYQTLELPGFAAAAPQIADISTGSAAIAELDTGRHA